MKSRIQNYPLSTSEHEWRSNIGYILFPTLILTPRYAGTLFEYHDGNPVKIFKRIFYSSFLPSYTSRRYYISSHHNNEFHQMIEKLQKGSHVMPGHYGGPLWNINIIFIWFYFWEIFGKFWQPLIICLPFFKVWSLKKQDKDDFKPNLNLFPFLSRRNARATL